jgi:hypothetical protein
MLAMAYRKDEFASGRFEWDAANSAEGFGPESLPELRVASSKVLLFVRKGLAGRFGPAHASLRLGIVAHVAFAALFLEGVSHDVIDLLKLPYATGARLKVPLR